MIHRPGHLLIWLLVIVQGAGLCRCLIAHAAEAEFATACADVLPERGIECAQGHGDDPADAVDCDATLFVRTGGGNFNADLICAASGVVDGLHWPDHSQSADVAAAISSSRSHCGRNLPLLI